ncbi:uncharacterized protein LDX57_004052 [Aspergillus melleus]|uniref:uncharacterized protein n=1 Tax=Aspergillus melleus TaxID=138277 RepID=UPI001E8EBF00|nr:uncharacterized protein LDX57_004052 [Aspergillus melleus]KAH8426306.1 hypothetical protein LDX57_004052 [Aspergillus melleus]
MSHPHHFHSNPSPPKAPSQAQQPTPSQVPQSRLVLAQPCFLFSNSTIAQHGQGEQHIKDQGSRTSTQTTQRIAGNHLAHRYDDRAKMPDREHATRSLQLQDDGALHEPGVRELPANNTGASR